MERKGNGLREGRGRRLYISGRGPQGSLVLSPRAPRPPSANPRPPLSRPIPRGWAWDTGPSTGTGAYWGVETVIGWQPRLLAVDPWCVSMHHCHPFAVLFPSSMVAYRAVCPTGEARQGDLAGSGGGSFLQGESTCMAADETSSRCWPTLANAGDSWPKGDTSIDAGERGSNAVSPDSSHPVHGSSFVFHAHTDVGQHSWRNPTR